MAMLPGIEVRSVVVKATANPPGLALPSIIISSNKGPLGRFTLLTTLYDFVSIYGKRSTYSDTRYFDAVATLLSTCRGVYVCRLRKQGTALYSAFSVNKNEVPLQSGGGGGIQDDTYVVTDLLNDWIITQGTAGAGYVDAVVDGANTALRLSLNPLSSFRGPNVDILGIRVTHNVPFPVSMTLHDSTAFFNVPGYTSDVEVRTVLNGLVSTDFQSFSLLVLGNFPYRVTSVSLLIKGEDVDGVTP
jgi:hypothetical protein